MRDKDNMIPYPIRVSPELKARLEEVAKDIGVETATVRRDAYDRYIENYWRSKKVIDNIMREVKK